MEFVQTLEIYELLVFIAAGLAVLFFGYRIKKIAFFIIWFLLGYNLMGLLMPTLQSMWPEVMSTQLYQILTPIAGGLLLALLGFSIEKLCVGGIAFVLVMVVAARYFGTDIQTLAISAVVGVLAAGAAVTLMKPAIIIATSLAGAYVLTLAILSLAKDLPFATYYWVILIAITVVGALFQFSTTKRIE